MGKGNAARGAFPELESHEGSWIVTSEGDKAFEFFKADRRHVETAARCGLRVETIGAYLARINAEIAKC